MKKVLKSLSILAILFLLTLGAAANEQIHVYLDGKELSFDTPPIIIDDNTLVPMRAVFEALGAEVKWDGDKQCVTANRTRYRNKAVCRAKRCVQRFCLQRYTLPVAAHQ